MHEFWEWWPESREEFEAVLPFYLALRLEHGERYLILFSHRSWDENPYLMWSIAKISDDGTITALTDDNNVYSVFADFDYTVEQVAQEAERAKTR